MLTHWKKLGEVAAVSASQVTNSPFGVGFEKLDRGLFDPSKAYDRVAALGVKWVRLQSGWQRTETKPGKYSFGWLDDIVDQLRKRGLIPWVCLCYGNRLYDTEAAKRFGGVGCPPCQTAEQRKAWHAYVQAVVHHFAGRVQWWEIWNEPDCPYSWRFKPNAAEYVAFARDTAAAIREGSSEAKVIGGANGMGHLAFLDELYAKGMAEFCDAVTFHVYSADETWDQYRISNIKALIRHYKPTLELIQGESGCQSRDDGHGALNNQDWDPLKQAKSLARHMLVHLAAGVKFASYFSCLDMAEALNGDANNRASCLDFGYFGVLAAEFDENGQATGEYTPKPSYRTLQVLSAIFQGDFAIEQLPVEDHPEMDERYSYGYVNETLPVCTYHSFRRPNGAAAFAYWRKSNLIRETFEGSITLSFALVPTAPLQLIDLIDGGIYALKNDQVEIKDGFVTCHRLPLFDRPMLLTFGAFC